MTWTRVHQIQTVQVKCKKATTYIRLHSKKYFSFSISLLILIYEYIYIYMYVCILLKISLTVLEILSNTSSYHSSIELCNLQIRIHYEVFLILFVSQEMTKIK